MRLIGFCCSMLLCCSANAQNLGIESGDARDFIVLKQPRQNHEITLQLRPEDPSNPPSRFVWERWDPNGGGYTEARRINWHATASCASGIDWISIGGPGRTERQNLNGTRNAISGRSNYDSFDAAALDRVCTNWARQATQACGENPMTEPGCQNQETFHFGPDNPLPRSRLVEVNGRCENGSNLARQQYAPRLTLECRLAN